MEEIIVMEITLNYCSVDKPWLFILQNDINFLIVNKYGKHLASVDAWLGGATVMENCKCLGCIEFKYNGLQHSNERFSTSTKLCGNGYNYM
jgi:hypothetical protein